VRVFLSHRTDSDGALAAHLAADLEGGGVAVWLAPRDVDPGTTWPQAIEAGLQACTHVVVLLSARTLESRAVQQELQMAEMLQLEGRVQLLPLLLERVPLPPWLAVLQSVDFTDYRAGVAALRAALAGQPTRGPALPGAPAPPGVRLHTVVRHDRLDALAAAHLGVPGDWRRIAEDNPGIDPLRLQPGTVLVLRRPDAGAR
jgi:hypothetical protein